MPFLDENTLGGRVKRYAQVSSAIGGLAARVVGERYLGMPTDRQSHAGNIKDLLGNLKGPLMKVAQFLATVPDALPPEYAEQLMELQANAPAMGTLFVKRRMRGELGLNWEQKFAYFELEASSAASLGQVHRARSLTGEDVACKLQYPDMTTVVNADLSQLKFFFSLYETMGSALETADIQEEIRHRLQEELDYHNEARNMALYRQIFAETSNIYVPDYYAELSTERLLTMSWMSGNPILSYSDRSLEERNQLAQLLFLAWYGPLYAYGVIHGDPHPGNYTVRDNLSLNLLDFGCVRIFPASFIQGVIELYEALRDHNQDQAVHAYETWGFKDLSFAVIEVITEWAKLLYDPLLDDSIRPIQVSHSGKAGWEMATKVHQELARLGGIRPPKEFVFMDRAAVGIGSVIMRLKAECNWHRLFYELIDEFSADNLKKRQDEIVSRA